MKTPQKADAIVELHDQLAQPLLRYLLRYVGDRATAEDLLQETLIRATRGLEGYAARASLKTWVYSIATRVAADYLRADEMNVCVREVIDSLPEDYRSALVLHEFEGMTAAQVAEVSECSVATAKIRIHRGRNRLREALQRSCTLYRDGNHSLRCDRKP